MPVQPGHTLSHYRLVEKIGEGGMGMVWKAEDTVLGRTVAIKVLPEAFAQDGERLKRFQREVKAVAALNHPNIVTIYSVEESGGVHFLTMELVEGETLAEIIPAHGLPLSKFFELAVPLADAVSSAHDRGVIHRDLKPANLMVNDEGRLKVLDFGLAKLREQVATPGADKDSTETLTEDGRILGTFPFMSPEQLQGKPIDHRSDIFSLGILLYRMATGQSPFKGDSPVDVISSILRDTPPPLVKINPALPRQLARIIGHCLEKEPKRRFQTALDLRNELEELRREIDSAEGLPKSSVEVVTDLKSIAVLPMENLSKDPEQDYFADGMTEALITDLAKIGTLKVISRTSAMQYKGVKKPLREIARELVVGAVVEGSVMRAGERVRITAQLINAATDKHIWAESYDRDLRDVLNLQSEVARTIAREVQAKLTPQEQARLTSSRQVHPEAHEAYLKGRYHWNKRTEEEYKKSKEEFQKAIEKDPAYPLAYAGLADAYNMLGNFGFMPPNKAYPRAKAAAARALEIDDILAEPHASLAFVKANYDWDWQGAEREYQRAIELNPGYATAHQWHAYFLASMGRHDESIAEIMRAHELDPLSRSVNSYVGWMFFWARQYDRAIEEGKNAVELDPESGSARVFLAMAYEQKRMFEDAFAEYQKGVVLTGGIPEGVGAMGHAYAMARKRQEALRILAELGELSNRKYVSSFDIALVYIGLGEKKEAFTWLEKAFEERAYFLVLIQVDPRFDPLRSDPRFQDLLRRMNFPE